MDKKIELPSNIKFGIFFSIIFLFFSWYFYSEKTIKLSYFLIIFSIIFLIITIFNSKILLPLNKLWMKFGLLLGKIVNPIVLGFIFFVLFTSISIFMKLIGRDELNLKIHKKKSNWKINKKVPNYIETFKRQF